MPRYIVRAKDPDTGVMRYALWSTVVDAPVTAFVLRDEILTYPDVTPEGMARVDEKGTSSHIHKSAVEVMSHNRAGNRERHLSITKIVRLYRRDF